MSIFHFLRVFLLSSSISKDCLLFKQCLSIIYQFFVSAFFFSSLKQCERPQKVSSCHFQIVVCLFGKFYQVNNPTIRSFLSLKTVHIFRLIGPTHFCYDFFYSSCASVHMTPLRDAEDISLSI